MGKQGIFQHIALGQWEKQSISAEPPNVKFLGPDKPLRWSNNLNQTKLEKVQVWLGEAPNQIHTCLNISEDHRASSCFKIFSWNALSAKDIKLMAYKLTLYQTIIVLVKTLLHNKCIAHCKIFSVLFWQFSCTQVFHLVLSTNCGVHPLIDFIIW